jgi:hypothetical protein
MKPEARDIHVLDGLSRLERRQLHPKTIGMLGLYASLAPGLVELPKPFVPEGLDHQRRIACCASRNKRH